MLQKCIIHVYPAYFSISVLHECYKSVSDFYTLLTSLLVFYMNVTKWYHSYIPFPTYRCIFIYLQQTTFWGGNEKYHSLPQCFQHKSIIILLFIESSILYLPGWLRCFLLYWFVLISCFPYPFFITRYSFRFL